MKIGIVQFGDANFEQLTSYGLLVGAVFLIIYFALFQEPEKVQGNAYTLPAAPTPAPALATESAPRTAPTESTPKKVKGEHYSVLIWTLNLIYLSKYLLFAVLGKSLVEVNSPDAGKGRGRTPSKTPAKSGRGRSTTPSKRKGGKNEDLGTFQSPDGGERRSSRLRTKTPRKTDDDF